MKNTILLLLALFTITCVSAIGNTVPIQIQTTDALGNIETGTYEFTINISNSSTCSPVLYSNISTFTTDNRGIVSYDLTVDLDFSEQYYLCYYRDGILKDTKTIGTNPYSFRSNVSDHWDNLNTFNTTQFENDNGFLHVVQSWWDGLYCKLTGCTMTGDLNMGKNNITNVSTISAELVNASCCLYVGTIRAVDGNSINFQPSGDIDDYTSLKAIFNRPTWKREGGKYIYFESSNVNDMGLSLRKDDTYSGTLNYEKDNNKMTLIGKNSPIAIKPNSEYNNYIEFGTYDHQPQMSVINGTILKINDSLEVVDNLNVSDVLFVNGTSGNVGIGTGSPDNLLTLAQSSDNDRIKIFGFDDKSSVYGQFGVNSYGSFVFDSSGETLFTTNGADTITFRNGGTGNIRLADLGSGDVIMVTGVSTGNVGIGTTSPSAKLEVAGDIFLQNDTDKLYFGQAKDVSIEMNGTSLNILNEVSSIPFYFQSFLKYVFDSDVEVSGDLEVSGNQTIDGFINHTIDGTTRHFSNGCYEKVNSTGMYWIC